MRRLFDVIERVSASESNALIQGETGTGKELVAAEIVRHGPRAGKPVILVDCGALSPSLAESLLFGHVRGSFTGAGQDRLGAFESAEGGTVFLDEIGELPLATQPKLLRVIEARELQRVGESRARRVDVRILAATNRSLQDEVRQRRFRADLFFRLSVLTVDVPPLRDRHGDVEILTEAFLRAMRREEQGGRLFTPEVLEAMTGHHWPGNVRELRNFVEAALVLDRVPAIRVVPEVPAEGMLALAPGSVDIGVPFGAAKDAVIAAFEREYVAAILAWSGGNLSRAARRAQMHRMNLHRLARRHNIAAGRALRED